MLKGNQERGEGPGQGTWKGTKETGEKLKCVATQEEDVFGSCDNCKSYFLLLTLSPYHFYTLVSALNSGKDMGND